MKCFSHNLANLGNKSVYTYTMELRLTGFYNI